jgi:hypothetical protein
MVLDVDAVLRVAFDEVAFENLGGNLPIQGQPDLVLREHDVLVAAPLHPQRVAGQRE